MWHRSIIDTIRQAEKRGMCLYGAGFWGKIAYEVFGKMGYTPCCFCDDDPEKYDSHYQGLPVFSLEDAVRRYPSSVYIVCIDVTKRKGTWNREQLNFMLQRLKECGVYDSNSELRIINYLFLLDIDHTKPVLEKDNGGLIKAADIENLLIFNHMSNSGSYYLEQLLDGHPNILSLPYSGQMFWSVYEKRLRNLEGEELIIEMMAQMLGYLHSEYENLYCVREQRFEEYCVGENGEFIYDVLIDAERFWTCLRVQFEGKIQLQSFGHLLKIYVAAYHSCQDKKRLENMDYWLFYHMHMPDFDVAKTREIFCKTEFKRIENLFIIREPVQHCFSWIRRVAMKQERNTLLKRDELFCHVVKSEMGIMLEQKDEYDNVQVIRFEDLKLQPKKTMKSLCKWLQIPYMDILKDTTLNGIKIYFPTYTESGVKYITGNDTTAVAQKDFSEVLTLWDEARLNIICSKFKKAYGYECEVPDFMEYSMEWLEGLLKENFRFCSIVQDVLEECGPQSDIYDVNEFVKSLYLDFMKNYQKDTQYYDYIKPQEDKE